MMKILQNDETLTKNDEKSRKMMKIDQK